ncbi:hypothetical protein BGX28_007875 [Mortierella sp. GBA30]|nr:hypothetical protein BGX28_007875 [Mortierella sp. GBA30]
MKDARFEGYRLNVQVDVNAPGRQPVVAARPRVVALLVVALLARPVVVILEEVIVAVLVLVGADPQLVRQMPAAVLQALARRPVAIVMSAMPLPVSASAHRGPVLQRMENLKKVIAVLTSAAILDRLLLVPVPSLLELAL